ncbi:DUF1801 domain-containing protein [Alkalicoccus urumqiensis]|uniref:YdhG-like domain-containing protein n=1 Tax=Alkalicoccus urumqiensis TaxID=1548213 RepID=A0A2P6MDD7_ALKUR|nr:DUF1801 domain-containing protein [Alkalicoccus urumqiensis]PRO64287.1 hypothetical protein C6I21_15565 [Alkalicoccus urumqiensis]
MSYEQKTKQTDEPVEDFLQRIPDETRKKDAFRLKTMMEEETGASPVMWGESIVGFGYYSYTYASGHSGEWMKVGFSPRKKEQSLYLVQEDPEREVLLKQLGKHRKGAACVYITRLENVEENVLRKLIRSSWNYMSRTD